jgi:hypothetical protein
VIFGANGSAGTVKETWCSGTLQNNKRNKTKKDETEYENQLALTPPTMLGYGGQKHIGTVLLQ